MKSPDAQKKHNTRHICLTQVCSAGSKFFFPLAPVSHEHLLVVDSRIVWSNSCNKNIDTDVGHTRERERRLLSGWQLRDYYYLCALLAAPHYLHIF